MPWLELKQIVTILKHQRRALTCNRDASMYNPRVATREMIMFLKMVLEKKVPKVRPPCDIAIFWIPFMASRNAANCSNTLVNTMY